jgi:hypothetical protein
MKIFVKYTAFSVLSFGHDLSTQAASDLPIMPTADTSTVLPSMTGAGLPITHTDITQTNPCTAFEAEFDNQIRRAVTLFDRIYGRTIDTTPEYLLEVLDEACTFLGDRAPFRLDEPESLRVCQSFLKPLNSRSRLSITRPGHFDEHSFVPRLIIPMAGIIQGNSYFSEEEKILAATYFDTSDARVFAFDAGKFETALANPLVLKFFLLKTLSKCIVDFHVIMKMMLIEQLRDLEIPLSEVNKLQILDSLSSSFAVDVTKSPNVLIDGKIASIVHGHIDHLGSDFFLTTVRHDLLEYFYSDTFSTISQMCLSDSG